METLYNDQEYLAGQYLAEAMGIKEEMPVNDLCAFLKQAAEHTKKQLDASNRIGTSEQNRLVLSAIGKALTARSYQTNIIHTELHYALLHGSKHDDIVKGTAKDLVWQLAIN